MANAKLGLAVPLAAQARVEEARRVAEDAFADVRQHCPAEGMRVRGAREFMGQLPALLARSRPRRPLR